MTKVALSPFAMLLATGTAFAGSDHYGSNITDQPVAAVDQAYTASIQNSGTTRQNGVDTKATTGPSQTVFDTVARHEPDADEPGQRIWGD